MAPAVSASKLGGDKLMRIVKHDIILLIMNSVFEFIHPTHIIGELLYSYLHTLSHLIL